VEQLWQEGENVLTVALRSGSDEPLRTGMAKKGLTFPTHNDESGDLAARWQVGVTPTFLVIKDGALVSSTTGWSSAWGSGCGCSGQAGSPLHARDAKSPVSLPGSFSSKG
jgi:hypothetical protein